MPLIRQLTRKRAGPHPPESSHSASSSSSVTPHPPQSLPPSPPSASSHIASSSRTVTPYPPSSPPPSPRLFNFLWRRSSIVLPTSPPTAQSHPNNSALTSYALLIFALNFKQTSLSMDERQHLLDAFATLYHVSESQKARAHVWVIGVVRTNHRVGSDTIARYIVEHVSDAMM